MIRVPLDAVPGDSDPGIAKDPLEPDLAGRQWITQSSYPAW